MNYHGGDFDVIVVGAGHAGVKQVLQQHGWVLKR